MILNQNFIFKYKIMIKFRPIIIIIIIIFIIFTIVVIGLKDFFLEGDCKVKKLCRFPFI